MADSGIRHVVSTIPVPQSEFEDEEFHALMHGTTFPASPVERQLYYRDDTHKWYIYNGTAWTETTVTTVAAHKATHQDGGSDEISIAGLAGSPAQKAAASGLASLNASTKVVEQPAAITDHLEGTPTEDLATKAPTSEWAFDHKASKTIHHSNVADLTFIIDGGGSAITTGEKGHLEIPFACTIKQVSMLADQSGSIVVDIWKDTYANFPPDNADSITASAPPTISSAQKSQDATLTGWTTAITAGDILAFNVDSCTTITRVTISLKVEKS